MKIRDATASEILLYAGEHALDGGVQVWGAIAEEEGGEVVGHLFVTQVMGQMFGHATRYWGADPAGALRLWLVARKRLRMFGERRVLIHIPETDTSMREFWERRGAGKIMTIYSLDLTEGGTNDA